MRFLGKGDDGYTGLLGAGRVPKYDLRPETYGTLDEATSALGLARASTQNPKVKEIVYNMQKNLYLLMAELATAEEAMSRVDIHITKGDVARLEGLIEELQEEMNLPHRFVLPGGCLASAAIDLARAIVRRAERRAAELSHKGLLPNPQALRYLNRLSSLLFVLARYEEESQGIGFAVATLEEARKN